MVQSALVEIRLIAESRGKQAADLADAFHNLPREAEGWGQWDPAITRGMLREYQDTYHDEPYPGRRDYVAMLDRALGTGS